MESFPFGVYILPESAPNAARTISYSGYIQEILRHAGLPYREIICSENLEEEWNGLRLLLTVGEARLSEEGQAEIRQWVESGGVWISIGGTRGVPEMFGVEVEQPAYSSWGGGLAMLGEGYLLPTDTGHPILADLPLPLHFFNGTAVRATDGKVLARVLDAHQRPTERVAVTEKRIGRGLCLLLAPDITGTIVRIQQGLAVTRDGVPSGDGTAPIADAVLKSGDGGVLDWIFDRQPVEGVPGYSAFLQPIADLWRELLLRTLFYAAQEQEITLPLLWLYPRNLPAVAHLSHDTDGNGEKQARLLLEMLQEANVQSTWCVILPGYPPELISAIRDAGHELAMHFDAMSSQTEWCAGAFHEQWRLLKEMFGGKPIVSNKNHYLRWEGDCEFFEWCEAHGIRLDQSKGASKTGEAGYNFGTCHLYHPVRFDGSMIDVLEMATPTQDFLVFAPDALLEPLLQAVLRTHGVLHLLFHPAHIEKPGVAEAILNAVRRAHERSMEWWTAERLSGWEIGRQNLSWQGYCLKESAAEVEVSNALPESTFLWLSSRPLTIKFDGVVQETQAVTRWGFPFQAVTCGPEPERSFTMEALWEPTP